MARWCQSSALRVTTKTKKKKNGTRKVTNKNDLIWLVILTIAHTNMLRH